MFASFNNINTNILILATVIVCVVTIYLFRYIKVLVDKNPKKVIVFDYGILDALDHIGEDIIGLPKKSVPPYLDKYKSDEYVDLGTLQEPNFETIYELKPDVIIISARQASLYDEFKKIAPTIYLSIDGGDYINTKV